MTRAGRQLATDVGRYLAAVNESPELLARLTKPRGRSKTDVAARRKAGMYDRTFMQSLKGEA